MTTTDPSKRNDADAHPLAHDVAQVRKWSRATLAFFALIVVVGSFYAWRLKVDAENNARHTDQLTVLFANFDRVQQELLSATAQQTTLDCHQTAGRNEGIKASWHAFIDKFATPEQRQRPDVVKFLADLDVTFPVLTCPTVDGTPVVVPVPVTGPTTTVP